MTPRGEHCVHQSVEPGGARRAGGPGDLAEDRAKGWRPRRDDLRSREADSEQPGDQHKRAAEVGAARDLPRSRARLRCWVSPSLCAPRVPCLSHVQRAERRATLSDSWPEIQPETNGSDAATTSIATATLVGKPTAKTFICGTTRETTPKATSVISSAARTGAPISSAEVKIVENACSAPPISEPQLRRLGQRDELEGAPEPAQRPGVAADDQEDHRPEERVEARHHGAPSGRRSG